MKRLGALPVLAACALAVTGCGGAASAGGSTAHPAADSSPAGAPLLGAARLPGLHAVTRSLGPGGVVLTTPVPGLRSRLTVWGFRTAREREFTGRAHQLSHVVSLGVRFAASGGAASYEHVLVTRAGSYLGAGATVTRMTSRSDGGWLIEAQSCGCHPVPPTVIAVVRRQSELSWLSVTGPGATPARVRRLVGQLPFQSQPL